MVLVAASSASLSLRRVQLGLRGRPRRALHLPTQGLLTGMTRQRLLRQWVTHLINGTF